LPALIGERATAPLPDPTRSERVAVPARDRGENAWIAQALGAEPVAPGAEGAVLRDARFLLARELATAGEPAIARALLRDLVAVARGRPHELVDLARAAAALGLHDVESAAGRTLLATISPAQQLSAPRSILALSYPLPFEQEMAESAREFGVPLLLLAALVRQESAFDPGAVSFAGARGLTQVIDSTGAQIARALGVPWSPAALLEPATSLRFGAYYFAHQLARFDGDVFAATAAYNAGGGSAQRWRDAQRLRGADGFLLAIDFEETRRFVPRVLENYAWYRYIYAGAPAPALR
ncbi:MAG: lytic transglycosylase domain-containing protein, partial [Chloroflexi bacterium]|nr:lytic transglycosylase domain-containing protein [Chloroflexota bacterium]